MFGHILRSQNNAPAYIAINSMRGMRGRRGRHQSNLISVLKSDLRARGYDLIGDFEDIVELSNDRVKWRKLGITHQGL